jgi:hypothetical protein
MSNEPNNEKDKDNGIVNNVMGQLVPCIKFKGKIIRIFYEDAVSDIKSLFVRPVSVQPHLIHTLPIFGDIKHNKGSFVFSEAEHAETDTSSNPVVRCVQKEDPDDNAMLSKIRIVINDSYPSIDVAAMAAANKIITEMKKLNCEYSISIYQCSYCKEYFLGGIRKGYKKTVSFDGNTSKYIVDKVVYDFTPVAIVHSHPIIRDKDWCPDIGKHVDGGKMNKACCWAKYDDKNNRYCCTVNENNTGGNHDFSTDDYILLHKKLKTSAIGYLVAKKESSETKMESDGWTLLKFEWPQGNDFEKGVNVWKPKEYRWGEKVDINAGEWNNIVKGNDGELLYTALTKLKDCNLKYEQAVDKNEIITWACACRTLSKAISDIITEKNLLKEMSVTFNSNNLSNDRWKTSIEFYMDKEGWKTVSKLLEYEITSENNRKIILWSADKHGWKCNKDCTIASNFRCGWGDQWKYISRR